MTRNFNEYTYNAGQQDCCHIHMSFGGNIMKKLSQKLLKFLNGINIGVKHIFASIRVISLKSLLQLNLRAGAGYMRYVRHIHFTPTPKKIYASNERDRIQKIFSPLNTLCQKPIGSR